MVKESKMLCPTELGEVVNDIMKMYFADVVNIDFTANMEGDLDKVERWSSGVERNCKRILSGI